MKEKFNEILTWSEKYTKTDMNYVVRGGFWLNLSHVISIISGFVLAIAFANHLSPETLGTYKYILSIIAIIGSFSLSGLGTAITRAVAKGAEGEFLKGFLLNLKWGFFVTIIAYAIAVYYFINGNNTLAIGILIGGTFSPLLDAGELYGTLLDGRKSFKKVSLYRIYRSLYIFLGLLTTILSTDNPILIILIYFFAHTSSALFLFYKIYISQKPNKITDTETHRLGKHVSLMNLLGTVTDKIDDVLVFHYLGPIQLAIYSYAVAIPENLAGFTKQLGGLAVPKYAQQDIAVTQKTLVFKSFIIFLVTLPIAIAYILFAPYIFDILFKNYDGSVIYTQIYAIILLINSTLPSSFLDAHKAIKVKYKINFINNSAKIIFLICGVYWFGLLGVIVAKVVGKLFSTIIVFYFAKNLRHIN